MINNLVSFGVAWIAALAALASLDAHAQTMRGDCSAIAIDGEVDRTTINEQTENPVQVLVTALQADNRIVGERPVPIVVELCNVQELDLTEHLHLTKQPIIIKSDRALIAAPGCARGPRKIGPRIRVRGVSGIRASKRLFEIRGDNVVISGFQLEGPHPEFIVKGKDNTERGITIAPDRGQQPIRRIEICNMDMYHWSGAAIEVLDNTDDAERGRLFNTNEGAVHIKNNFLHHNRHGEGWGYGVVVGSGAYALIERNVFDENRHAIAGDSVDARKKDFSGYTARENLILPGGGVHCSNRWVFILSGWRHNCWQTHQIDMHGDKSWWRLGQHCCGTAGETILIERNTILYIGGSAGDLPATRRGYAIKIRGNPADKAVVDGNVFLHYTRDDAIAQNGNVGGHITNPIQVRPNKFGINPLAVLDSCDFVGGSRRDHFMATGVTWWALSPVTNQWRYLNTMPEMLPQLQLVDVDNDGICDVAERPPRPETPFPRYSKSGTEPWTPRLGGEVEPGGGGGGGVTPPIRDDR